MKTPFTFGAKVLVVASTVVLVALFLLAVGFWLDSGEEVNIQPLASMPILTMKLEWKDATFQVHSTSKQGSVSVRGKMAGDLTAFVTECGHVWAGHEQSFYIETECGVLGGDVEYPGSIKWVEIDVAKQAFEKTDVDAVVKRLEEENGLMLGTEWRSKFNRKAQWTKLTCLEHHDSAVSCVSTMDWFELAKNDQGVQVSGNTVRLQLINRFGRAPTVWIDNRSKKLLKAVEYGKQVFPKSFLQTVAEKVNHWIKPRYGTFDDIEAEMTSGGVPFDRLTNELSKASRR